MSRTKVDRETTWRELARQVGGTFELGKRKRLRVTVVHDAWTITLDTYLISTGQTHHWYTRAHALFVGTGDLRLLIRRRWLLDGLLGFLGMGGITPGNRRLADRYTVRGRPENRVRRLTTELAATILDQPSLHLEVKPAPWRDRRRMGQRTKVVTVQTSGIVTDVERLSGLITVVKETLNALVKASEAAR